MERGRHVPDWSSDRGQVPGACVVVDGRREAICRRTNSAVLFEAGKLWHKRFVSIWGLLELKGIEVAASSVTVGALTTYTEVQRHPLLRAEFPLLAQAAAETGGIATQNRGTLGGNIVNASPAADSPPALLVYDAELEPFRPPARAGFRIGRFTPATSGWTCGRMSWCRASGCRVGARGGFSITARLQDARAGDSGKSAAQQVAARAGGGRVAEARSQAGRADGILEKTMKKVLCASLDSAKVRSRCVRLR